MSTFKHKHAQSWEKQNFQKVGELLIKKKKSVSCYWYFLTAWKYPESYKLTKQNIIKYFSKNEI